MRAVEKNTDGISEASFSVPATQETNPAQTLGARIPEGGGGSIYKHMYVYVYICYFAQDLNGGKLP